MKDLIPLSAVVRQKLQECDIKTLQICEEKQERGRRQKEMKREGGKGRWMGQKGKGGGRSRGRAGGMRTYDGKHSRVFANGGLTAPKLCENV